MVFPFDFYEINLRVHFALSAQSVERRQYPQFRCLPLGHLSALSYFALTE